MKRILYYFVIFGTIVILPSCKKTEDLDHKKTFDSITVSFEKQNGRTMLSEDGNSILWNENDAINVFYGSSALKFTSVNDLPSETATFKSKKAVIWGGCEQADEYIWSVYPYRDDNEFDGTSITTTVPTRQNATPGSFDKSAFLSIGRSKTTEMGFLNPCGGIKFRLENENICRVVFKSNGGIPLSGRVKMKFNDFGFPYVSEIVNPVDSVVLECKDINMFVPGKDYYISCLPASLSSGFTVRFYTFSNRGERISVKSNIIDRNTFGNIGVIDKGVNFIPDAIFVDLGLSVQWRRCNLGAWWPEEAGEYFAYGETETKSVFDNSSYKWKDGYDGNFLDKNDDAAFMKLGGNCRMPSESEFRELQRNCDWSWVSINGVEGYKVTSKKTGYRDNWIFLPASSQYSPSSGLYRSSDGYCLNFDKANISSEGCPGDYAGVTIRPVLSKKHNLKKIPGVPPSDELLGWKDYYQCENCGFYWEDVDGHFVIGDNDDLEIWKSIEGRGGLISPNALFRLKIEGQWYGEEASDKYADTYQRDITIVLNPSDPTQCIIGNLEPYYLGAGARYPNYNYVTGYVDYEKSAIVVAKYSVLHISGLVVAAGNAPTLAETTDYADLVYRMDANGNLVRDNLQMSLTPTGGIDDCYKGGVVYKKRKIK